MLQLEMNLPVVYHDSGHIYAQKGSLFCLLITATVRSELCFHGCLCTYVHACAILCILSLCVQLFTEVVFSQLQTFPLMQTCQQENKEKWPFSQLILIPIKLSIVTGQMFTMEITNFGRVYNRTYLPIGQSANRLFLETGEYQKIMATPREQSLSAQPKTCSIDRAEILCLSSVTACMLQQCSPPANLYLSYSKAFSVSVQSS